MAERDRCLRDEARTNAVARVAEDAGVRRELIWLRAREKGDDETIRFLERADRTVASRMHSFERGLELPDEPRARAAAFRRLFGERLAEAMAEVLVTSLPCRCAACRVEHAP